MNRLKKIFTSRISTDDEALSRGIKKITGITPKNIDVYRKAFTH